MEMEERVCPSGTSVCCSGTPNFSVRKLTTLSIFVDDLRSALSGTFISFSTIMCDVLLEFCPGRGAARAMKTCVSLNCRRMAYQSTVFLMKPSATLHSLEPRQYSTISNKEDLPFLDAPVMILTREGLNLTSRRSPFFP
ncbi:hypothetical protein D3C84_710640 [compost metagenome]